MDRQIGVVVFLLRIEPDADGGLEHTVDDEATGERDHDAQPGADQLRLAALALLEVAYADPSLGADERQAIATDLRDRWLPEGGVAGTPVASAEWNGVGERLAARFGRERRRALVERLWLVAMSGPGSEEARSRVLRSASALLGLSEAEAQEVALQAQAREPATP